MAHVHAIVIEKQNRAQQIRRFRFDDPDQRVQRRSQR